MHGIKEIPQRAKTRVGRLSVITGVMSCKNRVFYAILFVS